MRIVLAVGDQHVAGEPQHQQRDGEQKQEGQAPGPLSERGHPEERVRERLPEGERKGAGDHHACEVDDAAEEAFLEAEPVRRERDEDDRDGEGHDGSIRELGLGAG